MPQTLLPWPMCISIKIPKKNLNTKEISKKMIIGKNKKLCLKIIGPVLAKNWLFLGCLSRIKLNFLLHTTLVPKFK